MAKHKNKKKKKQIRLQRQQFAEILAKCRLADSLSGGVKASERGFINITNDLIVSDKKRLRNIVKELVARPLFKVFEDWLLSVDEDLIANRDKILRHAIEYSNCYIDLYTPDGETIPIKRKRGRLRKYVTQKERKIK